MVLLHVEMILVIVPYLPLCSSDSMISAAFLSLICTKIHQFSTIQLNTLVVFLDCVMQLQYAYVIGESTGYRR